MLQTIFHKKTKIYSRYLGHRDEGERRVSEEDELTGLLLGSLAFMPQKESAY
jgi:hypothetical protein